MRPSSVTAACVALVAALLAIALCVWLMASADPEAGATELRALVASLIALGTGALLAAIWRHRPQHPPAERIFTAADYAHVGLGPADDSADDRALYLDLLKRTLMNVIYEDPPICFYDASQQPIVAHEFDLQRRVDGEDGPTEAHTMIGLHRLNNIQETIEQIIAEDVPGDLLEAGVLRGGASIFMRGVLKAYGETERRVIACDTFRERPAAQPSLVASMGLAVAAGLASLPSQRVHRFIYDMIQKLPAEQASFPVVKEPSDELVNFTMFLVRNARLLMQNRKDQTGLQAVQSHFARYGLLDDQVLFLRGFFSETLPDAPIEQLAMIRLDGDLYESTMDVLVPLYPKLSPNGFCIIDDYHTFPDCRRAVDEFRAEQGITATLRPIDGMSVYWRKPAVESNSPPAQTARLSATL